MNLKTEQKNQNIEIQTEKKSKNGILGETTKGVALALGILLTTTPNILQAQNNTPKIEEVKKQNIDFVSYLGKRGEVYTKLKADKRQIFENIYNQILRDNGETVVLTGRGKTVEIETSKSIHSFMRNLCYFLYNLDAKEADMVKFHTKIIKQIEEGKSMGLKVNDDIMHRLYGYKIFAEQIDKEKEGWLNTPLEREKELKEIQKRIAELEKDIANLDKNIANLDKNIAKGKAELEVLKVVAEGLRAMKDM